MDMASILSSGQGLVALLGGGVAVETLAENYLMSKLPANLRPLAVPVVLGAAAVIVALSGGASLPQALEAAGGVWVSAIAAHNAIPSSGPTPGK